MRYRFKGIKTDIDVPVAALPGIVAHRLRIPETAVKDFEVRRRSTDSRKKPHIQFVYTADFTVDKKLRIPKKFADDVSAVDPKAEKPCLPEPGDKELGSRPVVIGMGPAGLFAGLELARRGYRPLILERGPAMEGRVEAVEKFRKDRVLDPEANMLFGEGGAGTFSDGKIGTGIKDSLIREVLREFYEAGAGEDIMYLAKPHIGTDVLRVVIVNIRKKIESLGGEILFDTKLESLITEDGRLKAIEVTCNSGRSTGPADTGKADQSPAGPSRTIPAEALILAIGHSARDTFAMINDTGLTMQQKPFSIGVRMEHPQSLIDESQYGRENLGKLPPADYRLSYKASNGRGVYSFCMCPGGEVVVCSTKDGELCVNGMSNRKRDSGTANSGILCDVRTEDFGSDDALAGVRFQERYERLAFENGGGDFTAPSCTMAEFLGEKVDDEARARMLTVTSSLPDFASEAIREAVPYFARRIHGYDDPSAVVTAVETRSSSPVRIVRDDSGESNIKGIFPAGEGAGYAGGITSAACDGIRAAWHIIERYRQPRQDL
ncbi:MAG: NAD(FAD)-utilizing dehydrogenase [Mogibacterium sp.]|nr:NAD(FAD)-utilizing dehydrogenase [Mogibacterium sp.]